MTELIVVNDDTTRAELEAKTRRLMAEQHVARGWDSQRARTEWLDEVDSALDAWLALAVE